VKKRDSDAKVSALRTEQYFPEHAARGDPAKALRILKRAGVGQPPTPGDELSNGKRRRHNTSKSH
jgi:hypothetical protein